VDLVHGVGVGGRILIVCQDEKELSLNTLVDSCKVILWNEKRHMKVIHVSLSTGEGEPIIPLSPPPHFLHLC